MTATILASLAFFVLTDGLAKCSKRSRVSSDTFAYEAEYRSRVYELVEPMDTTKHGKTLAQTVELNVSHFFF